MTIFSSYLLISSSKAILKHYIWIRSFWKIYTFDIFLLFWLPRVGSLFLELNVRKSVDIARTKKLPKNNLVYILAMRRNSSKPNLMWQIPRGHFNNLFTLGRHKPSLGIFISISLPQASSSIWFINMVCLWAKVRVEVLSNTLWCWDIKIIHLRQWLDIWSHYDEKIEKVVKINLTILCSAVKKMQFTVPW